MTASARASTRLIFDVVNNTSGTDRSSSSGASVPSTWADASVLKRFALVVKGLSVGLVAALTPYAFVYLRVVTDGISIQDTEGFNYAGAAIFAIFIGLVAGPTAALCWYLFQRARRWATLLFLAPSTALGLIIVLVVVSGDCLNETSPC